MPRLFLGKACYVVFPKGGSSKARSTPLCAQTAAEHPGLFHPDPKQIIPSSPSSLSTSRRNGGRSSNAINANLYFTAADRRVALPGVNSRSVDRAPNGLSVERNVVPVFFRRDQLPFFGSGVSSFKNLPASRDGRSAISLFNGARPAGRAGMHSAAARTFFSRRAGSGRCPHFRIPAAVVRPGLLSKFNTEQSQSCLQYGTSGNVRLETKRIRAIVGHPNNRARIYWTYQPRFRLEGSEVSLQTSFAGGSLNQRGDGYHPNDPVVPLSPRTRKKAPHCNLAVLSRFD